MPSRRGRAWNEWHRIDPQAPYQTCAHLTRSPRVAECFLLSRYLPFPRALRVAGWHPKLPQFPSAHRLAPQLVELSNQCFLLANPGQRKRCGRRNGDPLGMLVGCWKALEALPPCELQHRVILRLHQATVSQNWSLVESNRLYQGPIHRHRRCRCSRRSSSGRMFTAIWCIIWSTFPHLFSVVCRSMDARFTSSELDVASSFDI